MNSFDNEVFEFGNNLNEETNNFNYENINGLGESNYENEDLFNSIPSVNSEASNNNVSNFNNFNGFSTIDYNFTKDDSLNDISNSSNIMDSITENGNTSVEEQTNIEPIPELEKNDNSAIDEAMPKEFESTPNVTNEIPAMQSITTVEDNSNVEINKEEKTNEVKEIEEVKKTPEVEPETKIEMSDTPIDELKKLTEYEEDNIDTTNINSLFDKLSVNVKDASEIFRKNTNLKEKIDTRFEELKALQNELENSRRKQIEEIDKYRDEVLNKLSEKKSEIEKRLNVLKDLQATLEKEKEEFEEYKRKEQSNIRNVQKEVQTAYDERREELEHIEEVLRKQKDSLDEERNQLSLDKIQYEADKNDLANNLLKFNQIVNSFTNGIEMNKEE